MASTVELASAFIEGAPPGEVCTSTMIQGSPTPLVIVFLELEG